jgi:hypothetical protein
MADIKSVGYFRVLAVTDDVDTGFGLLLHDVRDRRRHPPLIDSLIDGLTLLAGFHERQKIFRARQASHMRRQNSVQ